MDSAETPPSFSGWERVWLLLGHWVQQVQFRPNLESPPAEREHGRLRL